MSLAPGNKKKLKDSKIKTPAIDDINVNANYGTIDEIAIGGTTLNNPTITYTPRYIDRKINFGSTTFNMKVGTLTTPPFGSTSMNSYNGLAGTIYGYSESFSKTGMPVGMHSTGVTSTTGFLGYGNSLTSYGFENPYSYSSSNLYSMLTSPFNYTYNLTTAGTSITASSIGALTSGSPTTDMTSGTGMHHYIDPATGFGSGSNRAASLYSSDSQGSFQIVQLVFFKNTGTGGTFPPAQPWYSNHLAGSDATNHAILVLKTFDGQSSSTTYPHLKGDHAPVVIRIYPNSSATGTPLSLHLNQTAGPGTPTKKASYHSSGAWYYAYSWNNITDATINSIDFTGDHWVRLEGSTISYYPNNGLVEEFGPTGANYTGYAMSDYYSGGDNVVEFTNNGYNYNVPASGEIQLGDFHSSADAGLLSHAVTSMEAFQNNDNTYANTKGYRKNGYLNIYDATSGFGTGVGEGSMTGTTITINSKTFEIVGTYYSRGNGVSSATFGIVLDPNGSNTSNPTAADFGSNAYFRTQQDEPQSNGPSQFDLRVTSSNTSADPNMNLYTETFNFGGGAGYPLTYLSWTYQSGSHSNYLNFVTFWEDVNAYYWYSGGGSGRDYSFEFFAS